MKWIQRLKRQEKTLPDLWQDKAFRGAYRLSNSDIASMPEKTEDSSELRRKLALLFHERLHENYDQLEAKCDIKRDTFQKMLRHKNGRSITYPMLAKFCIGACLSKAEAEELFQLTGHPLNEKVPCDYILLCTLKNRDDINDFDLDLQKYGYDSVLSKPD